MLDNLAVHGGKAMVTQPSPHFTWPLITEATRAAVLRQLDESVSIYDRSGVIARLEDALAAFHGVKHALLTCTGTAALHSLFVATQLGPGDEVLCPAYTFHATATPLFFTGARPVLVDAGADGNIDVASIEAHVTPRTRAIVVTHMWGFPCDMAALKALAAKHGLLLLEDGSHAHGAEYQGQRVGSFGHGAAFSLQGQKTLTGGEGGFLLTNDEGVYRRALAFGHYNKRCKVEIPPEDPLYDFHVTGMGLKLRIHPLAAAIAEQQLLELPQILAGRRAMAARMIAALGDVPGLYPLLAPAHVAPSWYAFILMYDAARLGGVPLEQFYQAARAEGCLELDRPISTAPLSQHPLFQRPGELFPAYKGQFSYGGEDFPGARAFHQRVLKVPVWHRDEDTDLALDYVAALRKVASHFAQGD